MRFGAQCKFWLQIHGKTNFHETHARGIPGDLSRLLDDCSPTARESQKLLSGKEIFLTIRQNQHIFSGIEIWVGKLLF